MHHAPVGGQIDAIVDYDRGRLMPAGALRVVVPGEPEIAYVAGVDLTQRREPLLIVGAPVRQPAPRLVVGCGDAVAVDGAEKGRGTGGTRGTSVLFGRTAGEEEQDR